MVQKTGRNQACWCGSGEKYKHCHAFFDERLEEYRQKGFSVPGRELIKNRTQIDGIRRSGKVSTALLDAVSSYLRPGISTEEIDSFVRHKTLALGGTPATLHYEGYPKSLCISINEQVCHGIPSKETVLREGDIVNLDLSTIFRGYFSDASRMFCMGKVSAERQGLVEIARACAEAGLRQVKPWQHLGNVGQAVQDLAAEQGCTVVREIGGHGIGLRFHEEPWVSYVAKRGEGILMVPGMVFTVEPIINLGGEKIYVDKHNGWTVYTADGAPSAQWEKTVLVTEEGHEILAH